MSETTGVARSQWQTADPVRQICRNDFDAAGLPKYSPHSIRRTLVTLGQQRCRTPEAFKGWSQNIGHEDVMTTFRSYRAISELRQAELMSELRGDELDAPSARDRRVAKLLAAELRDAEQASRNFGREAVTAEIRPSWLTPSASIAQSGQVWWSIRVFGRHQT